MLPYIRVAMVIVSFHGNRTLTKPGGLVSRAREGSRLAWVVGRRERDLMVWCLLLLA